MRLTELLLQEGRVAPELLKKAYEMQQLVGSRLGTQLLELGALREEELLAALGRQRQMRTVSAVELREIPPQVVKLIPAKLASRYGVVPFRLQGRTLMIASMDPGDPLVEDEIAVLTSCLARTHVALEVRIHEALERHYGVKAPLRLGVLVRRLNTQGDAWPTVGAPRRTPPPLPASPPPDAPSSATTATEASLATATEASLGTAAETRVDAVAPAGEEVASTAPETSPQPVRTPEPPAPRTYIELDESDAALLGHGTAAAPDSPEHRLEEAARQLRHIDIRDEIADAVLAFCAPYLERRVLLFRRQEQIVGWRGEGRGVDAEKVRGLEIATDEPSVFLGLTQGSSLWLGPLPALDANKRLVQALGGELPKDCLVLPVVLRSKAFCFLYADNLERGVAGAPTAELRRLVAKAAIAFEVYILKNKIRTL